MLVAEAYPDQPLRLPAIEDVKARVDLADLIGRDVKLWRRGRDHWGLCPFHAERSPSFKVNIARQRFKCFGCNVTGDALEYLQLSRDMDMMEAWRSLAIEVGLYPNSEGYTRPAAKIVPRPSKEEMDAADAERIQQAKDIWQSCVPSISGTLAETYLRARCLIPGKNGWPQCFRFHPALPHPITELILPALVAGIESPEGDLTSVWRTYLKADGSAKAGIVERHPGRSEKRLDRLGRGPRRNNPVRLYSVAGPELGIAEGIETAMSAARLFKIPTWAACGTNLCDTPLPEHVKTVHIFADNGEAGLNAANAAVEAFTGQRRRVVLHTPPKRYGDWNDLLQAEDKR